MKVEAPDWPGAGHAGHGAVDEALDGLQRPVEIAAGAAAGGLFDSRPRARPGGW